MKTQKKLVAAVLSVAMLLSLFGGSFATAAEAAPATTAAVVGTDSELAYEPLSPDASIAYEQHEAGYAASLDRRPDRVTLHLAAVPGEGRTQEGARLYIRTGVTLQAGTSYRVSFSLASELDQPEYAVCFDSAQAEGTFGTLTGRSVAAGGTDRVQYEIAPAGTTGELVLRLLLGAGSTGSALTFSELSVEEISATEVGHNVVLVDHLNYNAPGFIRLWTETGYSATVTGGDDGATLTVNKVPENDREVWKIQLRAATGVKPTAGNRYKVRYTLDTSAKQDYEVCYNDGDVEKGYDAQYDQRLIGRRQILEHTIFVPLEKKDPGELILQFNLGMLLPGEKVTLSNISVEEIKEKYGRSNLLPDDFSYGKATSVWTIEPDLTEQKAVDVTPTLLWDAKASVTKSGAAAGDLTVAGGKATMTLKPFENNVWDGRLNIDTGETLEAGTMYRVSMKFESGVDYGNYEVLFGSGFTADGIGNRNDYGELKPLSIKADTPETLSIVFTPKTTGGLLVTLQLGKLEGKNNIVSVSEVKVQKLSEGILSDDLAKGLVYPQETDVPEPGDTPVYVAGSFEARDKRGTISGDATSATITCAENTDEEWQRGLFVKDLGTLDTNKKYVVTFKLKAPEGTKYNISFDRNSHFDADQNKEKGFGFQEGRTGTGAVENISETIDLTASGTLASKDGGTLLIDVRLGLAAVGAQITVSDFKVVEDGSDVDLSSVKYPGAQTPDKPDPDKPGPDQPGEKPVYVVGSFESRDQHGGITGDGVSATITCADATTAEYQRGLFIKDLGTLTTGKKYKVTFKLKAPEGTEYDVSYDRDDHFKYDQEKEQGFGLSAKTHATGGEDPISHEIDLITGTGTRGTAGGVLLINVRLGLAAVGAQITVSDFKVVEDGSDEDLSSVNYPKTSDPGTQDPGTQDPVTPTEPTNLAASLTYPKTTGELGAHYENRETANEGGSSYTSVLSGDGSSVKFVSTGNGTTAGWARGFFIKDICDLAADRVYTVSFDVEVNLDTSIDIIFNSNGPWNGVKEYGDNYGYACTASKTNNFSQDLNALGAEGNLTIGFELGKVQPGTVITVKNVKVVDQVYADGVDLAADLPYPNISTDLKANHENRETANEGGSSYTSVLSGDGSSVKFVSTGNGTTEGWARGFFIKNICKLPANTVHTVTFDVEVNLDTSIDIIFNSNGPWNGVKEYGDNYGYACTASKTNNFSQDLNALGAEGNLTIGFELGKVQPGTVITVKNVKVIAKADEPQQTSAQAAEPVVTALAAEPVVTAVAAEPVVNAKATRAAASFRVRADDGLSGVVTGDGKTKATLVCTGAAGSDKQAWARGLYMDKVATLREGGNYKVTFDVTYSGTPVQASNVVYSKDSHFNDKDHPDREGAYKTESVAVPASFPATVTVEHTISSAAAGDLYILLGDLGRAEAGTEITVSNVHVYEVGLTVVSGVDVDRFATAWGESGSAYTTSFTKAADHATLTVSSAPASTQTDDWKDFNARLMIRTGVTPKKDTYYRVKFDLVAAKAQKAAHVLYNGETDMCYKGEYNIALPAGEKVTVSHIINAGESMGGIVIQANLGLVDDPTGNSFTVSNLTVEEVDFEVDESYKTILSYDWTGPSLKIKKTPFAGSGKFADNEWKVKMFIDTGVKIWKGETYRVSFEAWAEEDAYFNTCYNRDDVEKGYGSLSDIHLEPGKWRTVEYTFKADTTGQLQLQLMLGNIKAPNDVWINSVRVEMATETETGTNLVPADRRYEAPSAVTYWAHEDYTTEFAGSDDAITARIKEAPTKGAEPWKIKLFLDTGVILKPGKYYKVSADVTARSTQDFEVCYNNGNKEMGYDSYGGLRAEAGKTVTVVKTISVPADKKDTVNLLLQFNLGKTTSPNDVTVSGVKVEEVALSYGGVMPANFSYAAPGTVVVWNTPEYTANVDTTGYDATLHITDVPATGAEVWKTQMRIHTGAVLSAGKTYLVRAELLATNAQGYEVCFNNEEIEKGFDVLYGQWIDGGVKKTVEKSISVPASMTDAGELVIQFSVGGAAPNDINVSGLSVQELSFGAGSGEFTPDTVVDLSDPMGTLVATREELDYRTAAVNSENLIRVSGAGLRAGDLCTVTFTAKADQALTGAFALTDATGTAVISQLFDVAGEAKAYTFTTPAPLASAGAYELLWRFASASGAGARVEISDVKLTYPSEVITVAHSLQNITVNGVPVTADTYNINNGNNYVKLRDLAMMLGSTAAQFAVRYNGATGTISLTTGKSYSPVGGELTVGEDLSPFCIRNASDITINGETVNLKAYTFGGYNFFRLRDLNALLGFKVDYIPETNTIAIQSPLTPEAQEKAHAYDLFFLPEIDGESQPYVGDTMPYYEDGTYYIYYLKDGGDAYNHSFYLTTTKDFVTYTEVDDPVLSASREDVQDNWLGTGSMVKVEDSYYFFYTGFNASGSQEYHEKIMVAKGTSPTSFEKVSGWAITPPGELGQKNDFRDPQAYYDPATRTISLTVTAGKEGRARILKYTLSKDLKNVKYDGIIFTDPTGYFWNMECSDTFQLGDKWYLTYSGQDDTLWYASANSRFGPYSEPQRLEGTLFYAAKHVEDGKNSYMVGWAKRGNSPSATDEVAGWAGNVAVQKLVQRPDGSLMLAPVDAIVSTFEGRESVALETTEATLSAVAPVYQPVCTSTETFMLKGDFTYSGTGAFGLAFDFDGTEGQYKRISLEPAAGKLALALRNGDVRITETKAELKPNQKYSFTYIQDGSVGIFYVDGQTALTVRLYGVTGKPISLFAENNNVTFSALRQFVME